MEKKKYRIGEVSSKTGQSVAAFMGKAKDTVVKRVHRNGDGALDLPNLKDASAFAGGIGNAAKNAAGAVKGSVEAKSHELALKTLQPIFADDLDSADFLMPKLIRITEVDKRHAESAVCQGAIGFMSTQKGLKVINIFRKNVDAFGLTFYPDLESELYYVDPSDRDRYLALDDYFDFLKVARVNELQKIAQDLGAKHFRVTFKEQKTSFSEHAAKAAANLKSPHISVDAAHDLASTAVSMVEIAAEMDCPGHAPTQPKLFYLQREPSIQTLIALRMDKTSPISHQKYTLKLSDSSGIKEKDAIKIDAALKAMKFTGNATVTSEARHEARRFLEYEIDF
jgi:hypothetical protein